MIIGIDIGNTTIEIGFIKNLNSIKSYKLSTDLEKTKDDWLLSITALLRIENIFLEEIENIFIASVVPQIEDKISHVFYRIFKKKPLFLGRDIKIPIKNLYKNPEEVGVDRLLNAYSAVKKIKPPLIVVDIGTAITFDIVNNEGAYEGGLIFPGIEASIDCLFKKTAKLPKIRLQYSENIVGKTTVESINTGILWGYISVVDGLVEKIEKFYGESFKIVITGGASELIAKGLKEGYILNRKLTMEGFFYISRDFKI